MNDEVRKSITIKIKLSIQREARHAAIELGKRLGQWMEEAIQEKVAREEKEKKSRLNRKDLWGQVFLGV